MAQFCERFIPNFSVIFAPLHDLTKPNVPYVWSKKFQKAFVTIKDLLTSAPILWPPDSRGYFILETDASDKGEGVCLKTRSHLDLDLDHQQYIVAYGSHKFDATEERWTTVEKEAHTILFGVKKIHHYLSGKSFLLHTDSQINTCLQTKRALKNRKLLNRALELSEYNYEIQHICSKNNGISDCLSRLHRINVLLSSFEPELNHNDLKSLQSEDTELFAAMNYLASACCHFDVNLLGSLKCH